MNQLTDKSTGAQGVAQVIASTERPTVFGLPGGHTVHIFDALRDLDRDVEGVLVREESLATVMAEAYGRLAGRPAVVLAQGAWVLGAGGIGVMEAHLGASPMVILIDATEGGSYSHHGPYQSGLGNYGAFDLPAAMAAITKRTFVALDPIQAVQMTQLAFKHAVAGEPGPVCVVFHSRALLEAIGKDVRRIHIDHDFGSPMPVASTEAVRTAGLALSHSQSAVVLAGNGARGHDSRAAVRAFAEGLDLPVATTPGGKSVFPEQHPLAAGVIGAFGHDTANRLVGESDVIVAVGTKIGATDTMEEHPGLIDGNRQTIIQIDVEPLNLNWTHAVEHPLLGTAADVLPRLADGSRDTAGGGTKRIREIRSRVDHVDLPELQEGTVVNPRALSRLLAEILPSDSIVTCDAGENRLFILHDYQSRDGGTVLQPNGGGGMGYAIPAALAATYTNPDQLAVAVLGDGGYAMTLHGLMTAIETRRRLLVVVMDNQALGWVLHGQGERPYMSEFAKFDLTAIAAAIGCTAATAASEGEIRVAVSRALDEPGVHVLVVKTSLSESFLTLQSSMAGISHEQVMAE